MASGALLRAFNKENGPKRQARSSYGILRTEPFRDWEEHKHRKIKPTYDAHDGMPYITNTIDWVLKLVRLFGRRSRSTRWTLMRACGDRVKKFQAFGVASL